MKEFFDKVTDVLFDLWAKMEKGTEKLAEKFGIKVNAPLILGTIFLIIFAFIIVKAVLSWVMSSL